jgi:MFS family permease
VSFAQLQLEDDLDFSDTIFGLGAGIFSLGYVLFGVPSNLALKRFGARRWLAWIMIAWGLLSASTMFMGGGSASMCSASCSASPRRASSRESFCT